MSLFVLWLRKGPLIKYVRNWWGVHPKCIQLRIGGGECHTSGVRTYYLFSCFRQHFCVIVSCFICRNLALTLFIKGLFVRDGYFSSAISIYVCHEISFFCSKLFLQIKVSKNAFNFNQIEA